MKLLFVLLMLLPGCTASEGRIDAKILTEACDIGSVILAAPGVEPLCADISLIEQLVESWNHPADSAMHAKRPVTQTDLYMMAKASGRTKPVKVH